MLLEIKDLHVSIEEKEILKGITMTLEKGKIHALMGPNGSGKSTLAHAIMGHPKYTITKGSITLDGKDVTEMEPNERAQAGLFLSFQYPCEISGVTIPNFLRTAYTNVKGKKLSVLEFNKILDEKMELLDMKRTMLTRYLNEGFSGGEKKRAEILQLLTLDPQVAVLDETDSGLDIDALRVVSKGVNSFMNESKSVLIITHYKRILEYIKPDKLFIMIDGKIKLEGSSDLVDSLEEKGYGWILDDEPSTEK
ncbi:MAG: Fe-S cluster assembly ATPase SufC [Candidatus Woesearchaeota archaeon]